MADAMAIGVGGDDLTAESVKAGRAFAQQVYDRVVKAGKIFAESTKAQSADSLAPIAGKVASAFSLVTGAVNGVVTGFSTVKGVWNDLVSTASRFVAAANPSLMEVYNAAVQDLSGAIGRQMTPIIRSAMRITRSWADAILNSGPGFRKLSTAIGSLFERLSKFTQPLIGLFERLANTTAWVVDRLSKIIPGMPSEDEFRGWVSSHEKVASLSAKQLQEELVRIKASKDQAKLIWEGWIAERKKQSSFGVGGFQPSFVGLSQAREQVQLEAMKVMAAQMGEGMSEAEKQTELLKEIAKVNKDMAEKLDPNRPRQVDSRSLDPRDRTMNPFGTVL